ncbi:hypothetical protein ACT7DJ_14655 [Bacillus cereus]
MNLSIQDELQLFSEELCRHLTPSLLEELAKELGFVKKKTKIFRKRISYHLYLDKSKDSE